MNEFPKRIKRGMAPELSDKFKREVALPTSPEKPIGKTYILLINAALETDDICRMDVENVKSTFSPLDHCEILQVQHKRKPETINEIKETVSLIDLVSTPNDSVYCFVLGHGDESKGKSYLQIGEDFISAKNFEDWVKPLFKKLGFFYFGQCCAGEFAMRTGQGNMIGIAPCTTSEESNGILGRGTLFTYYFTEYFKRNRARNPLGSIEEAFDTATRRTSRHLRKLGEDAPRPQLYWQNNDPLKYRIV